MKKGPVINLEKLNKVAELFTAPYEMDIVQIAEMSTKLRESVRECISDWLETLESKGYFKEKLTKEELNELMKEADSSIEIVEDYFNTNKESNTYFSKILENFDEFKNRFRTRIHLILSSESGLDDILSNKLNEITKNVISADRQYEKNNN